MLHAARQGAVQLFWNGCLQCHVVLSDAQHIHPVTLLSAEVCAQVDIANGQAELAFQRLDCLIGRVLKTT